jgi:cytidylate kinase
MNNKDNIINSKIITIDGPSASGKGTIAKKIANILNFKYLDSGALYRVVAYIYAQNYEDITSFTQNCEEDLISKFNASSLEFTQINNQDVILLNQKNITDLIRSEAIGSIASVIASKPYVRQSLLQWQRNYATEIGLVTDGRDMGTVVFPQAKCKIFLVADVEKRAKRRHQQLLEQNSHTSFDEVLSSLKLRDERDTNRTNAPLKPADDALTIDNTLLSIDETIEKVLSYYNKL